MELRVQRVRTFEALIHIVKWLSEAYTSSSNVSVLSPLFQAAPSIRHRDVPKSSQAPKCWTPTGSSANYPTVANASLVSRLELSVSSLLVSQQAPLTPSHAHTCTCNNAPPHTHTLFSWVNFSISTAFQPTWRHCLHVADRAAFPLVIRTTAYHVNHLGIWLEQGFLVYRITQWLRNHFTLSARWQGH